MRHLQILFVFSPHQQFLHANDIRSVIPSVQFFTEIIQRIRAKSELAARKQTFQGARLFFVIVLAEIR